MTTSPLATALAYAQNRGWYIFPTRLVPRSKGGIDKIPCIKDWPNLASRDQPQIEAWWRQWPDAVPSLVTGPKNRIIVIDVDIKSRIDDDGCVTIVRSGLDMLEELGWWANPPTPTAHTRSGGLHYYLSCDEHCTIRNSAGRYGLGPNVDVRGRNGQVVLPCPTSGYSWDPHLDLDSVEMMPAPAWLDYRQPKPKPARPVGTRSRHRFDPDAVLAESCRRIATAVEGSRHDTYRHEAFRIARLVGLGLLDNRAAYNDLAAEVMALGKIADGHTHRVEKYFADAWDEGLAAARSGTRRARG